MNYKNRKTTSKKNISLEQTLPSKKEVCVQAYRKTSFFLPLGKLYCNLFSNFNIVVSKTFFKYITNKLESQILEYYYNGVEVKLIAEFLGVSTDIVYKRRRKFKDRYLAYCI